VCCHRGWHDVAAAEEGGFHSASSPLVGGGVLGWDRGRTGTALPFALLSSPGKGERLSVCARDVAQTRCLRNEGSCRRSRAGWGSFSAAVKFPASQKIKCSLAGSTSCSSFAF